MGKRKSIMKEKDFIKLKVVCAKCAKKFDFKLKAKRQITTRFWPKIYYKIVLRKDCAYKKS